MRELGVLLDRAVHQTFARFPVVVPAFIVADALGSLLEPRWFPGAFGLFAWMLAGMVLENRARVIVIASGASRRPGSWAAALRYPAALAFAVVGMVDECIPYEVLGIGAGIFLLMRPPTDAAPAIAIVAVLLVALAVALVVLAASLLIAFAGTAATFDTVLERTPPHRALGWWLRQTFRLRALRATLPAAAIFAALVSGVPVVLGLFRWGPAEVQAVVSGIPEGIADAIALMFVWRWRDAILEGRHGRDIQALLDAGVQPSRTVSPSASSPGVTTSQ